MVTTRDLSNIRNWKGVGIRGVSALAAKSIIGNAVGVASQDEAGARFGESSNTPQPSANSLIRRELAVR